MLTEKSKILVVDDEPEIVGILREFLAKKGYDVIDALSGEEALNILDREKTDLVLLDLMLPGLKGPEAARIIKNKYPTIKIVTLTAYPDMGDSLLQLKNYVKQKLIHYCKESVGWLHYFLVSRDFLYCL